MKARVPKWPSMSRPCALEWRKQFAWGANASFQGYHIIHKSQDSRLNVSDASWIDSVCQKRDR